MKGYIQVYTGDGKGKTTASLGLALRAAGAGLKVYIAQFVKGMHYSELNTLKKIDDQIIIKQYGRGCFINKEPDKIDIKAAKKGLLEIKNILTSKDYNLIILDEINIALHLNLISEKEILQLMEIKPESTELILTGRYASDAIIAKADLVTEMNEIKHYYQQGIDARVGIEK